MFSTAHDANILNANERVYFRFDNHGVNPRNGENRNTANLKVAVYRDGQQVVRCYSISDRPNSDGLRFSTRERNALVREIRRQNPNLREEDLNFEQYKVCMHGKGKSQGEAIATVFEAIREKDFRDRDKFAKYSASEINFLRQLLGNNMTIKQINGIQLNQNQRAQLDNLVNFAQVAQGQQGIDNFMEMLASDRRQDVRDRIRREILPYITDIYNNYRQVLENNIENRNQRFEGHGFLLGFLANFSHRYTIGIDLDLSPRNTHVAFLVRHQAERENIPIVINLAIFDTPSDVALNCAIGYAGRLHNSSFIPIHTESRNTVCVGLNFNLNLDPFSVDIVELQQGRFPLVQRLFEYIEDEEVGENIRDFLLQHLPGEIPRNAENYNRIFDCITGFAFGSSAFDNGYIPIQRNGKRSRLQATKHIFRYDDPDLRRCLTMVFHVQGLPIVILDVRAYNMQQQGAINLENLNVGRNNPNVYRVSCILNNQDNQVHLNTRVDNLGLYRGYQNANNFLAGDLIQVPNAENVHGISERVMNDGWQNRDQHRVLLMAISIVLMPENMNGDAIIDVDSNDKFRSMLHGVFYASDDPDKVLAMYKIGQTYSLKRRQEEEGERVMLTRITEQRLDLLLLRQSTENAPDTHPIVYVLGFADNAEEVAQKENNAKDRIKELMNKQRGYLPITPGNEVVLSSAVFNAGAQRVEDLISIPQELYIHRLDRSTRGLVGPESVIDENPPEGLLSDQTRENFRRFYTERKPGQNSIFLLDIDDNLHVPFSYLQGTRAQVIETLKSRIRGGDNSIPTAQEIRRQIRDILGNQGIEVNDLLTLEFATRNGHYDYWLQQIDIAHAGRLRYQLRTEGNHTFEVANLARNDGNEHIVRVLNQFRENEEQQRLTLIITLNNTHWVTLVIERQNGNYVGYYADSTATAVPGGITDIIQNNLGNNIRINNVSVRQQTDGWNCGLWALENASDINRVLNENHIGQVQNIINIIRDFLGRGLPNRDRNYFQNIRVGISQLFRNDPGFQDVQLQAYIQNREQIDPLLRTYLELGYHRVGGGYGLVEAPISLGVSDSSNFGDLPQSSLESPEASRVSDLSKGKGGR
ncbi:cytoplasmic incompatibility factor CifB [Wolbachia endosymbiont (group A) of Nomada goodeniana]|uniref:cytoplasmic incompatibility factor CifB n=1 Tax=Wolbachia endosymbiont (group A) of Nomada goodeniana TaxID=3066207 RepID=UPI003342A624